MNDLDPRLLMLFAKIVECSGVSAAARALSMPKATMSRGLAKLEDSLGTRLIERSSRKMRLTEPGLTIYQHCLRIADVIDDAKAAVGSLQTATRGRLRIASPLTFGRSLLSPVLPKFLARHPDMRVEVELTNRQVDPIEENFDLVIRLGPLADTSLVAKPLGVVSFAPWASSGYLRARAKPKHPDDLSRHDIIDSFEGAAHRSWIFTQGDERVEVEVVPRFDANDPIIRRDAAVAGLGISLLPLWMVRKEVDAGDLELVLPQWQSTRSRELYVLFPNRRSLSAKSRAFLSFLEEEIPPRLTR